MDLKKQLNDNDEKLDVIGMLEEEIIRTENKINKEIYKSYGLTDKEIKTIEDEIT